MGVFSFKNDADNLGVLDLVPEQAAAAYSVRKLSKDYNGPAIRVRRSSDNAEQDIYFDGSGNLDTDSLLSFVNYSPANQLPLDLAPDAAAAYSLRNLSSSYVGSVVRVRRSSDNAEADFTAAEITNGTLTTWTGANDGFVVTWYDQSGNSGRDATQATAANQPKLVNAGVLVTENGKPAVDFDGDNDLLNASFAASQPLTFINVHLSRNVTGAPADFNCFYSDGSTSFLFRGRNTGFYTMRAPTEVIYQPTLESTQYLSFNLINGSASTHSLNGSVSGALNPGANGFAQLEIGACTGFGSSYRLDGKMQELIIYASDKSADRTNIEFNINSYYNIYSAQEGYVTTWYDQSGSGFDATQAVAANQPKIVNAGSLVILNNKPAFYLDGINDQLTSSDIPDINISHVFSLQSVDGVGGSGTYPGIYSLHRSSGNIRALKHDELLQTIYYYNDGSGARSRVIKTSYIYGNQFLADLYIDNLSGFADNGQYNEEPSVNLTTGDQSGNGVTIGNAYSGGNIQGKIQEFIFYKVDVSAYKSDIKLNINNYFKIF